MAREALEVKAATGVEPALLLSRNTVYDCECIYAVEGEFHGRMSPLDLRERTLIMAIIQAFAGALTGTFADQWKEIITAGRFDEYSAVVPGVLQRVNRGHGVNFMGSAGVISNGSKIFVPENTAAFIFSQGQMEAILTQPGGYVYEQGQSSVFNGDGLGDSIVNQVVERFGFGGQATDQKQIAFVNMREIRGIKFGTRGPLIYNDHFYGVDLEITAFGNFSIRIVDVVKFVTHYVPANATTYSFLWPEARQQLLAEFIQSFTSAINSLSSMYRISQLPSQTRAIAAKISSGGEDAGNWVARFGLEVVSVGIEAIEFTPESRALVNQYSKNRMSLKAYEDISAQSSNIAAQQKIAQGIESHGFGDGGGTILGMNLAQGMGAQVSAVGAPPESREPVPMSFDDQIEAVKKLKELLDVGVLSEDEFNLKKREIMGF